MMSTELLRIWNKSGIVNLNQAKQIVTLLVNKIIWKNAFFRLKYRMRMKDIGMRYENIERGQKGLKQKLVVFNNFIKEKRDKTKAGRVEMKSEKKSQGEKQVELDYSVTRTELLSESLTLLTSTTRKRRNYSQFLTEVVKQSSAKFENIDNLIENFTALFDLKSSLDKTLDDLNKAEVGAEISLEKFKEDKMRETLILNIKLVNLQRQASSLQAKTSERKTFLGGQSQNKCGD